LLDIWSNTTDGKILTLVPAEVPSLQLWLILMEEFRSWDTLVTLLGDSEGEVGVGFANTSLRAIDRRVNLKTDIEELTGKEVSPKVEVKEVLLI
jgi:hypothetical protein